MSTDLEREVQSDMGRLRAVIRALDSIGRLDDREEETLVRLSVDATSCYKN